MDEQVIYELSIIAEELVRRDPKASLADLLVLYFGYITGANYDGTLGLPPSDEEVVRLHLLGNRPDQIAKTLDDYSDYIRWLLVQYGFLPFTRHDSFNLERSERKKSLEAAKYEELIESGIFD